MIHFTQNFNSGMLTALIVTEWLTTAPSSKLYQGGSEAHGSWNLTLWFPCLKKGTTTTTANTIVFAIVYTIIQ